MNLSRAPSESPATSPAHQTSFRPDTGRTSPLPQNNAKSHLLPRSAKQYFHPGCTLCSLVASLPSEQSALGDDGIDGSGYGQAGPSKATPTRSESEQYLSPGSQRSPHASLSNRRGTEGRTSVAGRDVVYFDEDITVYIASGKERMCDEGKHLVVVLNRHVEKVYDLSPADVPTLSHMLDTAQRLLSPHVSADIERGQKALDFRIGFVGSVIRDPYSPHAHLHAHAMTGSVNTSAPGCTFYRRHVIFGSLNWWSLEDLRAEIREESSNNRVKSGYEARHGAPIDRVPDAGSVQGPPNAIEPAPYRDTSPAHSTRPLRPTQPLTGSPPARSPTTKHSGKGKMIEEPKLRLDQDGLPRDDEGGEYKAISL